jgi:transcriptional regulator with XRE-family HTH domain
MEGKFIMEQNVGYVVKALSVQDFLSKHPMKHEDLARLLGVCVDAVNSWSCGRRNPRPQVLTHLATLDNQLKADPEYRAMFVKSVPCTVS